MAWSHSSSSQGGLEWSSMDRENPAIIDKDIGEEKKGKKKEGSSRGFKKDFVYHLHPALLWKNKLCAEICMRCKHDVECNVKTDVESDAEVGWLCMAQTKPSARLTNLFQRHCRRNDSSTRGGDGLCTALGNSRQRPSPTLGLLPSSSFILLFISHPFPLLCPSSFVGCFTIVETCFSSRGKNLFLYLFLSVLHIQVYFGTFMSNGWFRVISITNSFQNIH